MQLEVNSSGKVGYTSKSNIEGHMYIFVRTCVQVPQMNIYVKCIYPTTVVQGIYS